MTTSQRIQLMSVWWPDACAATGWDPADRERRLEVLSDAVNRPLASASDLNSSTDIDRVKAHLLAISRPSDLAAQVKQANMPRTRLHRAINILATRYGEHSAQTIMRDRHGHADLDRLTDHELELLRNTLHSRLLAKNRKAREHPAA